MAYKDPSYDPQKAHEYYERHKKLKGRKRSTKGFNKTKREQLGYAKSQLQDQRTEQLSKLSEDLSKGLDDLSDSQKRQLENIRNIKAQRKEALIKQAQSKVEAIRMAMRGISDVDKHRMIGKIMDIKIKLGKSLENTDMKAQESSNKVKAKTQNEKNKLRRQNQESRVKIKSEYEDALDKVYKKLSS